MVKARRTAEAFTPDGIRDRMSGLSLGAHLFREEVRAGMEEKETDLRRRLGLALDGPLALPAAEAAVPASHDTPELMEGTRP
jgi:hypothetical protein